MHPIPARELMLTSKALSLHSALAQQVMFLNELEELLELTQSPDFAKVAGGCREQSGTSGGDVYRRGGRAVWSRALFGMLLLVAARAGLECGRM